jgi:hypothetical protein
VALARAVIREGIRGLVSDKAKKLSCRGLPSPPVDRMVELTLTGLPGGITAGTANCCHCVALALVDDASGVVYDRETRQ